MFHSLLKFVFVCVCVLCVYVCVCAFASLVESFLCIYVRVRVSECM